MTELMSRPLFTLSLSLHPIQELGRTPAGERRVVPVSDGRFEGDRLSGEVLPHGGSDLLLTRADGSFQQDVRLTLRTGDEALVLMTYRGVRHAAPEVGDRIARARLSTGRNTICGSPRSSRRPRRPMPGSTGSSRSASASAGQAA